MLKKCKELLLDKNINPASTIEYDINGQIHTLTLEWILSAYLETHKRDFFIELFEKVMQGSDADIETFFQQMGQLILMSSLSDNGVEEI